MTSEKEKAYYGAMAKWAEKTGELVKYQQKNMKWFLSAPVVQWFTPSYESEVSLLEKQVEILEKKIDMFEKEAGLIEA